MILLLEKYLRLENLIKENGQIEVQNNDLSFNFFAKIVKHISGNVFKFLQIKSLIQKDFTNKRS